MFHNSQTLKTIKVTRNKISLKCNFWSEAFFPHPSRFCDLSKFEISQCNEEASRSENEEDCQVECVRVLEQSRIKVHPKDWENAGGKGHSKGCDVHQQFRSDDLISDVILKKPGSNVQNELIVIVTCDNTSIFLMSFKLLFLLIYFIKQILLSKLFIAWRCLLHKVKYIEIKQTFKYISCVSCCFFPIFHNCT